MTEPEIQTPEPTPPTVPADQILNDAVSRFFSGLTAGKPEAEVTDALDAALHTLAELHARRFPDYQPVRGVDYQIRWAEPPAPGMTASVGLEDLTELGAVLCEIWQAYTREVEYAAVKSRVAALSKFADDVIQRLAGMQKQLDNAMMDFNAIRRKIKA